MRSPHFDDSVVAGHHQVLPIAAHDHALQRSKKYIMHFTHNETKNAHAVTVDDDDKISTEKILKNSLSKEISI